MITSRGWWYLIVSLSVMVAGALSARWMLAYLGLTLVLWFIFEGFLFAFRIRMLATRTTFVRELLDGRGHVDSLWSGRTFEVTVRIQLPDGQVPYLRFI